MNAKVLAGLAGLAFVVPAPAVAAPTTRYVSPNGSGMLCSQGSPCLYDDAYNNSADGDTIVFASGDYTFASTLEVTRRITLEGAAGGPVPHLVITAGGSSLGINYNPTTASTPAAIRRLRIDVPNAVVNAVFANNPYSAPARLTIENVFVQASTASRALEVDGTAIVVRDSVARDLRNDGKALFVSPGSAASDSTAQVDLRNLTLDARGSGAARGLQASELMGASSGPKLAVSAFNVIARGSDYDIAAYALTSAPDSTKVTVRHSNFRTQFAETNSVIDADATNQSGDPLFTNAAAADYHLLAGSPAIDHGTTDPLLGSTDPDGNPRVVGAAPDIGAYEAVPGGGGAGGGGGGGGVFGRDTRAPKGSALAFSPHTFLPLTRGGSIAVTRGSRVSYRLDEAARVRFTVQQPRSGRRVGKRCVAPTRRNRRRRRCTRYVTLSGSFTHAGKVGKNSFRFSGRLRGKALKPGSYRLSGVPTDAAGNHGRAFSASFTIAKPPRRRR